MSVSMSRGITGVHLPLNSTITMAFRRAESKDIVESPTGFAAKQVSMSLPTYEDIKIVHRQGCQDNMQQHYNK